MELKAPPNFIVRLRKMVDIFTDENMTTLIKRYLDIVNIVDQRNYPSGCESTRTFSDADNYLPLTLHKKD